MNKLGKEISWMWELFIHFDYFQDGSSHDSSSVRRGQRSVTELPSCAERHCMRPTSSAQQYKVLSSRYHLILCAEPSHPMKCYASVQQAFWSSSNADSGWKLVMTLINQNATSDWHRIGISQSVPHLDVESMLNQQWLSSVEIWCCFNVDFGWLTWKQY